ncbi:MAG: hypothetical protein Q9P01_07325 [Anaerolineae bacterium]|nr:hypothetical protein [Anaerolineae bacterium]
MANRALAWLRGQPLRGKEIQTPVFPDAVEDVIIYILILVSYYGD